ncbi:MAG: tyrosine-type recombinase/integrase [Erysipelotrichaceae bacterium]|nr:tyrosine-type recombinase/integrase [Erysipelotrichaceae bacterium]
MSYFVRKNPKTNQTEYKVRYSWKDASGKKKDSKTGWFSSIEEAEAMAQKLKSSKQQQSMDNLQSQRDAKVETVYHKWLIELEERANRETTENTTTDKSYFNRARTIYTQYLPDAIRYIKVRDLTENDFRIWLNYLNSLNLSGKSVRNYKLLIIKFNQYLGNNGYYVDPELDMKIDTVLSRMRIKPKTTGERKDRRVPTVEDIESICLFYQMLGLGDFKNFYWYTLWHTLFYSGLRISELIGLQWQFVDFDNDTMDIRNSISERELKKNVHNRVKQEIYHTKNAKSERIIPIFAKYCQLLKDYKQAYKYHFHLTNKQIEKCYVFPLVLTTKEDVNDYQKQKNVLRELNFVCKEMDVEKTDVQMMRHGCATWMVSDREDGGLGFTEEQAKDYFGHTGDDMLREVYAKLNKKQRANRTITTFSSLMVDKPRKEKESVEKLKELTDLVLHPEENEELIDQARSSRIRDEVSQCIKNKQEKYELHDDEAWVLNEIMNDYGRLGVNVSDLIKIVWIHEDKEIDLTEMITNVFNHRDEAQK